MTDDWEALEAAAKLATPGPWGLRWEGQTLILESEADGQPEWDTPELVNSWTYAGRDRENYDTSDPDFIAAANPTAVLALIAEVKQLRAEMANWRKPYEVQVPAGAACTRCGITRPLGAPPHVCTRGMAGWPDTRPTRGHRADG
jgi:hypothetical protein